MSPPVLLAFLLADKIFREAETGKVHIAGTFNRIGVASFPFTLPQLNIYLALTDLKSGEHILSFRVQHLEKQTEILKVDQSLNSPGPLEVIEAVVCFNQVPILEKGCLELTVSMNHDVVASRMLRILDKDDISQINQQSP